MDEWIHDEILDGLSRLLCLSLERTPAADMIVGTAAAWGEAITHKRKFDQAQDTPRFREAFKTLANLRRTWPAPIDFMDALPKANAPLALQDKRKASPDVAERALADLKAMTGGKMAAAGDTE